MISTCYFDRCPYDIYSGLLELSKIANLVYIIHKQINTISARRLLATATVLLALLSPFLPKFFYKAGRLCEGRRSFFNAIYLYFPEECWPFL